MWIFNKSIREALLLTRAQEILDSVDKVDKKVAGVKLSIDDLMQDLVAQVESLSRELALSNVENKKLEMDAAIKQAKIEELDGVISGALDLARRCNIR